MSNLSEIKEFLSFIISKSFIPQHYFSIKETFLHECVKDFQADYERWFPSDNGINVDKLLFTPQLTSVLCYRIAHRLFIAPPPLFFNVLNINAMRSRY